MPHAPTHTCYILQDTAAGRGGAASLEFLEEAFKTAAAGEGSEDKESGSSAPGEVDEKEASSAFKQHGK